MKFKVGNKVKVVTTPKNLLLNWNYHLFEEGSIGIITKCSEDIFEEDEYEVLAKSSGEEFYQILKQKDIELI